MDSNLLSGVRSNVIPAEAGIQSFPSSDPSEGSDPSDSFPRDLRQEFDAAVAEYGYPATINAIVIWMENQLSLCPTGPISPTGRTL